MLASAFLGGLDDPGSARFEPIPSLLNALLDAGQPRLVEAGEHVFFETEAASHVYRIEAGHAAVYRMLSDGRRHVIDFAFAGDLLGLGAAADYGCNAQAMARVRLRSLQLDAIQRAICSNPRLGLQLYRAVSCELCAARELALMLSHRIAGQRVASFLSAMSRHSEQSGGSKREFVLPMTRYDIGDFLGVSTETVSRTFTRLRALGVIRLEQSVLVTILDHERLVRFEEGRTAHAGGRSRLRRERERATVRHLPA